MAAIVPPPPLRIVCSKHVHVCAVYLWKSPTYREIWQRKSVEEGAIYSRFNFFLETDATYSLDEALKLLQEEREYEILPPNQQRSQEVTEHRRDRGDHHLALRMDFGRTI